MWIIFSSRGWCRDENYKADKHQLKWESKGYLFPETGFVKEDLILDVYRGVLNEIESQEQGISVQ